MGIKQIIALTALTASVSMLGINTTANAEEITHNNITEVIESNINPRTSGIFKVTAKSGANIRSGSGTNYSIVATARYGAELTFCNATRVDSSGVKWYKVQAEFSSVQGWISSTTGTLNEN
jgi:uncharacterized protein YgiM (DUF1202 family)